MVREIVVRQAGGSLRLTLPKAFAARLRLRDGDTVYAAETALGVLITPFDDRMEQTLRRAEGLARRLRDYRRPG